jgi:predicted metalloprotease with PDZ domain
MRPYVPVRVTNLMGVDLGTYRFDTNLTFAVLLMNADGTVYHRYGGRDWRSADSSLSLASYARVLRDGLKTHESYLEAPAPPEVKTWTLDDVEVWAEKVAQRKRQKKPIDCYHCHHVFDAQLRQGRRDGTWQRSKIWSWPPPSRVGLTLDRDAQDEVTAVAPGSAAERAGLKAGDRLIQVGEQRILSHADLTWALESAAPEGTKLAVLYRRGFGEERTTLILEDGWRVGTPLEFSWRPAKWQLRPRPGFGGPDLAAAQKAKLGLTADGLAFRVNYLVTWGEEPRYGREAKRAGIRKGDVVVGVAVGGEAAELKTAQHLHAWWRLTREPGDAVEVTVLRKGKRQTLTLKVLP